MNETEDIFHLGVKALIRNSAGNILLLKVNTKKLTNTPEAYWDISGGRIQRGSNVEETLKREIEEEIGVTDILHMEPLTMVLSNIRIPINPLDVGLILAIYTCKIDTNVFLKLSDEHTEAKWFKPVEAAELLKVKFPPSFTQEILKLV